MVDDHPALSRRSESRRTAGCQGARLQDQVAAAHGSSTEGRRTRPGAAQKPPARDGASEGVGRKNHRLAAMDIRASVCARNARYARRKIELGVCAGREANCNRLRNRQQEIQRAAVLQRGVTQAGGSLARVRETAIMIPMPPMIRQVMAMYIVATPAAMRPQAMPPRSTNSPSR